MQQRTVFVGGTIVLVALAGVAIWAIVTSSWGYSGRYGDNNANFPDGIHLICTGKTCGHGFTITVKQLAEHHADDATWGEPVRCPQCKANADRADLCKTCGKYYSIAGNSSATCPRCAKPVQP